MKNYIRYILSLFAVAGFFYPVVSQNTSFIHTSPVNDAKYINPEQTITLKTNIELSENSLNETDFRITGSESGEIEYSVFLSADGKTLILKPAEYYMWGEKITVSVPGTITTTEGMEVTPLKLVFEVADAENEGLLRYDTHEFPVKVKGEEAPKSPGGKTFTFPFDYPDDFPVPSVVQYGETSDEYIFMSLNPRTTQYSHYLAIFDKFGIPIYYRRMESNYANLFPLPDGNLAYARNPQSAPEMEMFFIMNSDYEVIDTIRCGNGYNLDFHDMLMLENGHYLVMSYDPQIVDMSIVVPGGQVDATVVGLVIQEVDNEQNVYFQWRSWDHFEITDATDDISLTSDYIDYVHGNAFDIDLDGNILLSSRHLDEITKINFTTGDVMWRFGLLSENNQFTIFGDPLGFSHQHDVRVLPNGNITLFDNGNLRTPQYSQALEYSINVDNMEATRVWYYQNQPQVFGTHTGSHRRQADGTSLIGWGTNYPLAVSEVNEDGSKNFDLSLPDLVSSYRAVRSPWETTLFETRDRLHFGNYSTEPDPKELSIAVTNNAEHLISITSVHNHKQEFFVSSQLPLQIPPGATVDLYISFLPFEEDEYNDVLTLNYDVASLVEVERIARQVSLTGIWDEEFPKVAFIPEFGASSVDPSTVIVISFDKPVEKTFGGPVTDNDIPNLFNFRLNDVSGEDIPFFGQVNEEGTEITIFPEEVLDENQEYYVEMKPNLLKDLDGNILSYPEISKFTTGELVSVDDGILISGLQVWPVPFADQLHIENENGRVKKVSIYGSDGSEVISVVNPNERMFLNTSEFSPGMYLLEVKYLDGSIKTRKLIKN